MEKGGEKTGHAHEPAEGKAVEKTKPSGIGLAQNGCDGFPLGWFAAAGGFFRPEGEGNQNNHHRKQGQTESVRPSKFLGEARGEKRCDNRPGIPRAGNAHDKALILRWIPASRNRQSYGETRARDTQQKPEKIEVRGSMCEAPAENQRK